MANHNRPEGTRHPGRHQSESPAGFDRNQVADITRNARPTSAESAIEQINRRFFAELYEFGLMPSLYLKPTSYLHERERRMVFELREDLTSPVVIVKDKELLQFVDVVDSFGGKPD